MRVQKAVITAAARYQRTLPLQTLIDSDGTEKSVLRIIVGHVQASGIDDIGVVIHPGDEAAYREAAGDEARHLTFIPQHEPRGYGHAVYSARDFVGSSGFLHVVGDHIYVQPGPHNCARRLVELAKQDDCSVSAVQPTRESLLPHYGVVAGPRITGRPDLYRIETVIEKPTPTEAEQHLTVTGLRAGYYLCFYGMHVLTPSVFEILEGLLASGKRSITLSEALAELARREQFLALATGGQRYDLGVRYGFLTAQLALALHGRDSTAVLSQILELIASRQVAAEGAAGHE
jgi:UTP--glucose-1-phosphate uridylyltransferase